MSCYHPMIRIEDLTVWNKAADGHRYHPAKIIKQDELNDIETLKKLDKAMHYKKTIIPCGKCIGCRLDYSQEWANRAYLESKLYKENYFVTLTYSKENLEIADQVIDPNGFTYINEGDFLPTLVKEHLKKFMHDLRQIQDRDYNIQGIRFLACGEYGEERARPHYHIILLNCPLPKETFYNPRVNNGNIYYQNYIIERAWQRGISNICPANWQTMAYTTRYITKKINGDGEIENYYANGIIKEFFVMSRMPGIGKPYYDLYKDEIYKTDSILVKTKSGVARKKPPKYFDEMYEKENPEKWREIKWKREKQAEDAAKGKIQETSLFLREQLEIEERSKEQSASTLKRSLEKSRK